MRPSAILLCQNRQPARCRLSVARLECLEAELANESEKRDAVQDAYALNRTGLPVTGLLAHFAAQRPWRVVAVWVALLVVAGIAATGIGNMTSDNGGAGAETVSSRAEELIEQHLHGSAAPEEYTALRVWFEATAAWR